MLYEEPQAFIMPVGIDVVVVGGDWLVLVADLTIVRSFTTTSSTVAEPFTRGTTVFLIIYVKFTLGIPECVTTNAEFQNDSLSVEPGSLNLVSDSSPIPTMSESATLFKVS